MLPPLGIFSPDLSDPTVLVLLLPLRPAQGFLPSGEAVAALTVTTLGFRRLMLVFQAQPSLFFETSDKSFNLSVP